jgi:hypothetical protein
METMQLNMERRTVLENTDAKALIEIFEQINIYNEIGYQTIQLALSSALAKVKERENQLAIIAAIEQLNLMTDRSRTASDKIERLARSGSAIASRIIDEKEEDSE